MNGTYAPYGQPGFQPGQVPPVIQQPLQQQPYAPRPQQPEIAQPPNGNRAAGPSNGVANNDGRRSGGLNSAAASLETVERALGDLRVANGARGGRRGGGAGGRAEIKAGDLRVPSTDFDFAGSNARFDKSALAGNNSKSPKAKGTSASDEEKATSQDSGDVEAKEKPTEEEEKAYNPSKSFFDSLSSSTQGLAPQGGGRGGRGRGSGRNRREEEREKNVATFGEPGGVGLMGPGAYVGGWGGYGRRGGGRGRRNPQVGGR